MKFKLTCRIPGNNKSEPIIGKRRRKLIAIGMNPLKKYDEIEKILHVN